MTDLHTIEPTAVLIEYDGPLLFRSAGDQHDLLVRVSDREGDVWTCLAVPTTDDVVVKLESGALTVRVALTSTTSRPRLLTVQLPGWAITDEEVLTDPAQIDEHLPPAGLMLRADLQPLLSVKLEGPELRPGRTPRAAWIHAFKDVPEALKTLLDFLLGQDGRGRPSEATRAMYALPAQSLNFASLEVSFGRPGGLFSDPETNEVLEGLGQLLEKALLAADGEVETASDAEREAILAAASKLAPPSRGVIRRVSFGGPLAGRGQSAVLNQRTRRKVSIKRKTPPPPVPRMRKLVGQVRELDLDEPSFHLRGYESDGSGDMAVFFDEEALDVVLWALETEEVMTAVVLLHAGDKAELFALGPNESGPESDD